MINHTLSSLLTEIYPEGPLNQDKIITGLTLDSRSVQTGDLFFACRGTHLEGRVFIQDAISKGAAAVLLDALTNTESITWQDTVPIIPIKDLKHQLSTIAARFYGHPADHLKIIGITGTNGKTSCTHFIASALHQLNLTCGVLGTLGNGLYGALKPSSLTTPDALTLQKTLADFVKQGAHYAAMEVSSHSIDQGRVDNVPFNIGIFTNLTRDHLDYHGTMAAYGAAKQKLFEFPLLKNTVINADDVFGQAMLKQFAGRQHLYSYGLNKTAMITADQVVLDHLGIQAKVSTPWGNGMLQARLLGQFNLSNLLAVLTTLCVLEIPFTEALACLSRLNSVTGRMQTFGREDTPLVIVDYAHTPDALEKALQALRGHTQGKLYCVFGCGGDRDRGKRPLMAKIAETLADHVIVTDDNPRTEDPGQIVADIQQGFMYPDKINVQHDRSKAISNVIQYANVGDCILVAGKGAETYQHIGNEKIPFSDIEKVQDSLEKLNARLA